MNDIVAIVYLILVILFSMTIHELTHGLVAHRLGDDTARLLGRLTLNPLKHVDPFMTVLLPVLLMLAGLPVFGAAKPVPVNPARLKYDEWGMALVAAMGPITNLLIAFLAYGIYVYVAPLQILQLAVVVNLGFFVFNMLPIPPLDGSRVLYAIAPDFLRDTMMWIERFGVIFIFAIILIASPLIGAFMESALGAILQLFSLLLPGP